METQIILLHAYIHSFSQLKTQFMLMKKIVVVCKLVSLMSLYWNVQNLKSFCFSVFSAEPAITLFLRNMSVAEEQTISFVCKASGSPMPKFTWYRDNKRIKAVNRNRYEIKPMPHGSVLRIEPVKARRDSGKFTCEAENDYGDKVQTSAFLHVYPVDQKGR